MKIDGLVQTQVNFNPAMVDAFARLRSSQPVTLFDSKQIADKQPLFWDDQQISGAVTSSVYNTNQASTTIAVTAGVAGVRARQTFRRFNYQPGKSQLVFMTAVFGNNSSVSVGIRTFTSGVSVDNKKTQAEWSVDKMDGTGPSGLKLDFSKSQIFFFDYEWLGVGTVAMGVVVDRTPYYIHFFNHANNTNVVYMSTPNLPLRYEIISTVSTITKRLGLFDDRNGIFFEQPNCVNNSLVHICSTVISEGGFQDTGFPFGATRGATPLITNNNTSIYPLISMRLKSGYLFSSIKILDFSVNCITTATYNYYLILNPVVTGNALVFSGVTNSSIETDTTALSATTLSGGTVLHVGTATQTNEGGTRSILNSDFNFGSTIAGVSDILVLAVQRLTGTSETFYGALNWKDQQ